MTERSLVVKVARLEYRLKTLERIVYKEAADKNPLLEMAVSLNLSSADAVRLYIQQHERFSPLDVYVALAGYVSREAVRMTLHRLYMKKAIKSIQRGVYERVSSHPCWALPGQQTVA